jgi:hypothetical protein
MYAVGHKQFIFELFSETWNCRLARLAQRNPRLGVREWMSVQLLCPLSVFDGKLFRFAQRTRFLPD